MQNNKFFDDFTKIMTSAVNAAFDARKHMEENFKQQAERAMQNFGFVARDELDTMKEVVNKSRRENDTLKAKVAELEKKLASKPAPVKAAPVKAVPAIAEKKASKPTVTAAKKSPTRKTKTKKKKA